jgi:hypothetical protein
VKSPMFPYLADGDLACCRFAVARIPKRTIDEACRGCSGG